MFEPLPGHGEDNSRHMERAGMVTGTATARELCDLLADAAFWATRARATAAAATELFARPCTAECLDELRGSVGPTRAMVRARRLAAVTATVMALGMADRAVDAFAAAPVHDHGTGVTQTWEGR
jgi:hypothetical protein